MTDVRFYADENVSTAVIEGIRRRGIEVLSTPEATKLAASISRPEAEPKHEADLPLSATEAAARGDESRDSVFLMSSTTWN